MEKYTAFKSKLPTDPINLIRQFNTAAGNTNDRFNPRQAALYTGLQCEELAEKLKRLGFGYQGRKLDEIGLRLKKGLRDARFTSTLAEGLLDDDVDLFVVTVGSMLSMGVDIDGAIAEVNRANMAKLWPDGTMHRDKTGKIVKPEGWTPPDLSPYVCGGAK